MYVHILGDVGNAEDLEVQCVPELSGLPLQLMGLMGKKQDLVRSSSSVDEGGKMSVSPDIRGLILDSTGQSSAQVSHQIHYVRLMKVYHGMLSVVDVDDR